MTKKHSVPAPSPLAEQRTINSLWRQSKPRIETQRLLKPRSQALEPSQPPTLLPSPHSTPKKRKAGPEDQQEEQYTPKRARRDNDQVSEPAQLLTPESTPTKNRAILYLPQKAVRDASSRSRTGRDLLNSFKSTQTPDCTEASLSKQSNLTFEKTECLDTKASASVKARNAALVARLADKQKKTSTKQAPMSAAEASRQAALHRLPEVVRAIGLPLGLNQITARRSYSATGLARTVKQSARSVIGEREVLDVLHLLETEAEALRCHGFVRFLKVGESDAVVVDSSRKPNPLDLNTSVQLLLKPR